MARDQSPLEQGPPGAAKHWFGFLVSGCTAFLVDAVVLDLLVRLAGVHPLIARIFAIACAMTAGWLLHRRLTFAVAAPPSMSEYVRYVASASLTSGLNYALYAAALIFWLPLSHLGALLVATAVTTVCSYIAMRYYVYRASPSDRPKASGSTTDDRF